MSKDISAYLKIDADSDISAQHLLVATTGLLVELSLIDKNFMPGELSSIVNSVVKEFDVSSVQAGELLEIVEYLGKDKSKFNDFMSLINQHFNDSAKQRIVAMAWKLINADGETSKDEAHFAAHLRKQLNLTLEQAAYARKLAEDEIDLEEFAMQVNSL